MLLSGLIAGVIIGRGDSSMQSQPESGTLLGQLDPTPTPTPGIYYGEPLLTTQEAISQTLLRFPEGHQPHSEIARLISKPTLYSVWFEGDSLPSDSEEMSWPVWLVGVLGNDLTLGDTLDFPSGTGVVTDTTPVDGMYYVWEANTGYPVAAGGLISTTYRSYDTLVSILDEPVPIVQPTLPPPPPPP